MEKIIVNVKPIDWAEGDVYGMSFRLSEHNSNIRINCGDGKTDTYFGKEIRAYHDYNTKDENLSFMAEEKVQNSGTHGIATT